MNESYVWSSVNVVKILIRYYCINYFESIIPLYNKNRIYKALLKYRY